jgi:hypothetical protein
MTLTVRRKQLDELESRRFEARVAEAIGEHDATARAELESAEGRVVLRQQCAAARRYGLLADLDVARYVVTAWLLGTDFDQRFPAMQQLLASPRLRPRQKADAIEQVALAALQDLSGRRA